MIDIFMWNELHGTTMEHATRETLQHFMDRKKNVLESDYTWDEDGVEKYLENYKETHAGFGYFKGSADEFEVFKLEQPIKEKADKGQLALDLVVLVSQIKTYVVDKIYSIQYQINDNQWKFTDELLEVLLGRKTNADLSSTTGAAMYRNLISHTWQPQLNTWKVYLKNVRKYFTDLTTLVNGGLVDILPFERDTMVEVLQDMKNKEKAEYDKLHAIIGIDEIIEPAEFTTKMEEITHMVEGNTIVSVPITTPSRETLAQEMGNAKDGA